MRLINGDKLLEIIAEQERWNVSDFVYESIKEAPTIDAEPTRHGKWIKVGDNTYRCSRCNEVSCCNGNFCTDCGARMDENEISNIARESADKISKALEKVRAKGMQKQNIKEDEGQ